MARIKISILLAGLCLLARGLYGQVDPNLENLKTVIPPSPNAASLGQYGEWPVSLYTGMPNISLPIYEVKGRNLSVPIAISYHAGGIRVGDIASWVGLGWSLSAGGCITRSVQGLPDEVDYFYSQQFYTDPSNFGSAFIGTNTQQCAQTGSEANSLTDEQQDIYSLNVLGRSYRIFFKPDTTAYTMPQSNIRIVSNFIKGGYWKVILEDGTQLVLGDSASNTETTSNVRISGAGVNSYPSAWYLHTVTSAQGEVIKFSYTSTNIVQDTYFTESDYVEYYSALLHAGSTQPPAFANSTATNFHSTNQTVNQLSLNTIESDLTRVYFIPSAVPRTDLQGGAALAEVKVLSKLNNAYVEDWLFNYNYTRCVRTNELVGGLSSGAAASDSSYFHYRLKLMNLTRQAVDNSSTQAWNFIYNPTPLPARRSFAQDHWGFYNGAGSNISLLPQIPFDPTVTPLASGAGYYPYTSFGFMQDIGQNRDVNENYLQAEMLNQVTFPTGGSTVFTYEANSTPANLEVLNDTTVTVQMRNSGSNPGATTQTVSYPFTLTSGQYVYIGFNGVISTEITQDFPAAAVSARIIDASGTAICSIATAGSSYFNLYKSGNYTLQVITNVTSGDYSDANAYVDGTATFNYRISHGVQNVRKFLGGVRIKSIQDFDGVSTNPVNSRYYAYDSAFIINPVDPINDYLTSQTYDNPPNVPGGDAQFAYVKITRSSSTKFSMGAAQGTPVGYGKVTTYNGFNGTGGYTISNFSCDPMTQGSLTVSKTFPYPPADPYEWRNGLLLNERTYTATGQLVSSENNYYSFAQTNRRIDSKVGYNLINQPVASCTTCGTYAPSACGTFTVYNNITNEQVFKGSTTKTAYNTATGESLSSTTNYYYDDALNTQPTRTVDIDSKGDTVLVYSRTPLELSAINSSIPLTAVATAALDTMVNRNIVGKPVESEKYVKGVLTAKVLTNYRVLSNNLVLPDNVMWQNGANAIETRVQFPRYDGYGNLVEQLKTSDARHSYIYAYTGMYPIAEVINADSLSIAYTSFETAETGNWTITGGTVNTNGGLTGNNSYTFTSGASITKTGLNTSRIFLVTYWSKGGALTISGSTVVTGLTKKGWTFYQHTLPAASASVSITGSGIIADELRLYPNNALITTYAYAPLVGTIATCSSDNLTTYYQYDGMQRLLRIRDMDSNIVKQYAYQYLAPAIYFSTAQSASYTRNNCAAGGTPSSVTYTVPAGTYTSTLSQADANAKATNDASANGQNYANINGTCTFYNVAEGGTYTRNNCATGGTPATITYTVPAGRYSATTNQSDANQLAINDVYTNGQNYANTNATCTFYSVAESGTFTCSCGTGGIGSSVTYTVPANAYTSTLSQSDANQQAFNAVTANGQAYANANGTCTYYNTAQSGTYTRNNCSCVYTGTSVTYTVAANTYSSNASQTAANTLAANDVTTNGQTYANTNGSCTTTCVNPQYKISSCTCLTGTLEIFSQTTSGSNCITQYAYYFSDGTYLLGNRVTTTGPCKQQ